MEWRLTATLQTMVRFHPGGLCVLNSMVECLPSKQNVARSSRVERYAPLAQW